MQIQVPTSIVMKRASTAILIVIAIAAPANAQAPSYKLPPQAVIDIIDAPRPPVEFPGPDGQWLVIAQDDDIRSITELARPFLKFAGMRVYPHNNSQVRTSFYREPFLLQVADRSTRKLTLPAGSMLGAPLWSSDAKFVMFPRYTDRGVELWVADVATGQARNVTGPVVNATLTAGYRQIQRAKETLNASWTPDGRRLLVLRTVDGRGEAPRPPAVPLGPVVMDTSSNYSRENAWEDLSKNAYDETLFEYYGTAQMIEVDVTSNAQVKVGPPGLYIAPPAVSPDGRFIVMQRVKRPYSYWVRYREFSVSVEIWDRQGRLVRTMADLPPTDQVTAPGKRRRNLSGLEWQAHKPATLTWIEEAPVEAASGTSTDKNRLMRSAAPFDREPEVVAGSRIGFDRFLWLATEDRALVTETSGARTWRKSRISLVNVATPADPWRPLFDYVEDDREGDPGTIVERVTSAGDRVALQDGPWIYLSGVSGSSRGDVPFLDKVNVDTGKKVRLFQSREGSFETFVSFVGRERTQIVIGHETKDEPRALRRVTLDTRETTVLTEAPHPYPQFRGITKQVVTYTRSDGVGLAGTLYLPASHKAGDRLPLLIWAYPGEFIDARIAGQVRGNAGGFTALRGPVLGDPEGSSGGASSVRVFATQGYAVLFMASMPVIGDPKTRNDTYIEQIVAGARAAIEKLDSMGIADPKRVGMAGHSYGGFSTTNLLANSDLFAAGIARSGAANRTLNPWGFHAETRSLWEAQETYLKMSPLFRADKIKAPILIIHGENDDSQASKPIESLKLFHALRGHGATARMVVLPLENHAYAARESILDVLAEKIEWFDRYVKNKAPAASVK